ncbi:MAG TPA: glycosyltransferase family 9 protein, partial [Elusimicrobiota bacterium]|nr:glycosyltransferase family 9 protein [Elusimicrobiota bacterium]
DPRPRARVPEADRAEAARVLEALKLPRGARPVLVFAGNFKKFDNRWPEEKFAALLDALRARNDVAPILLSGPGEEAAVRAIAASRPVPVLGPYPIGLTAALIERAGLLVSSATGTAHLAVAVGATLVSVLGRYTRAIWMPKPGAPKHFCAVSESWTSCRDVPVEKVLAELDRALRADAAPARG